MAIGTFYPSDSTGSLAPAEPVARRAQKLDYIPEQCAIIESTEPSIKVRAGAGTGKTSTLIGYADRRKNKRFLMLAFNKAIQEEASARFGGNVECRTGHSIAYKGESVGSIFRHKLSPGAVRAFEIKDAIGVPYLAAALGINTVNQFLCSADREIGEQHAQAAEVKPAMRRDAVKVARRIWDAMKDPDNGNVKITHDGYLKLFHLNGRGFGDCDCVLLDEAQDTNPVMSAIVSSFDGDKVYVGDRNQSIYAFRGAQNAMDDFIAKEYPLMSSFRFGQEVADVANVILRYSLGERSVMTGLGPSSDIDAPIGNKPYALLARTNGSLIEAAADGMEAGRRIAIIGGSDSLKLGMLMDVYKLKIYEKSERAADFNKRPTNPVIAQFDSFDELEYLSEESMDTELSSLCKAVTRFGGRVPYLVAAIKSKCSVSIKDANLVLSTAHKSKGLEFNNVVLANDFKNPGDKDGIDIQEANLLYVAATRAKHNLVLNEALRKFIDNPTRNPKLDYASMRKFGARP